MNEKWGNRGADGPICPWELLSEQELASVHAASVRILSEIGTRVDDAEALALLKAAGAQVQADGRVKLGGELIDRALASVPHATQIYDRDGAPAFTLADDVQVFGGGSDTVRIYEDGAAHDVSLETVERMARVQNGLSNYDFVMSMGSAVELPDAIRDGAHFLAMLENTTKPIIFTAQSMGAMEDVTAMATALRGSIGALREKPFCILYAMPTAPLIHTAEALRGLLLAADAGIPCIYGAAPMKGATGPITMLGTLALANAETLFGLVLSQLKRPGAPFVHAMTVGPLEMKTMVNIYNGPESMEIQLASCQLARWYGLPSFATAGCSDAKLPDAQAAAECAMSLYTAVAAGASVVHDVGYLESGLCASPEQCALADELIDQLRFLKAGFARRDDDFLFEEIEAAGIGGDYLMADATLERHKQEIWYPSLFDHKNRQAWENAGAQPVGELLAQRALRAQQAPCAPLGAALTQKLHAIAWHE